MFRKLLSDKKAQQAVEYLVLFAVTVTAFVFLMSPGGLVTSAIRKAVDRPFCWIEEKLGGTCKAMCGNGTCETDGLEDCWSCPEDCGYCVAFSGAFCGNGVCEITEKPTSNGFDGCWADCGVVQSCGDGKCDPSENCYNCYADCPTCCGDGKCTGYETCDSCPAECGSNCSATVYCGNGVCDKPFENVTTCNIDCPNFCGDGYCDTRWEDSTRCPLDCPLPATCGNGTCDSPAETCGNCPGDCSPCCGDGTCDGQENCLTCFKDCGACNPKCGNGSCDAGESCDGRGGTLKCALDCKSCNPGYCGNGVCEPAAGENSGNCTADCQEICGDGNCSVYNLENCITCPADCPTCSSCGDGFCDSAAPWPNKEWCLNCGVDCNPCCGDGYCYGWIERCYSALNPNGGCQADCGLCPNGVWCGNGVCDAGESYVNCPVDCKVVCGDGACNELCSTCPQDCGNCPAGCGDGICDTNATPTPEFCANCPADCGICTVQFICGDGICDGRGETCATCPADCPCTPGTGNSCGPMDIFVPGTCGATVRFGPVPSRSGDIKACPGNCQFGNVSVGCLDGIFSAVQGRCDAP